MQHLNMRQQKLL